MEPSDKFYYHDSNYKREFNTDKFYKQIILQISEKLKRPLNTGENRQVVTFIKKLDPDVFKPIFIKKSIPIIINTLVGEFLSFKCGAPKDIDTRQILKNNIGKSSESGTTHGIYDDPSYTLKQLKPNNNIHPVEQHSTTEVKNNKKKTDKNKINEILGLKNINEAVRVLNPKSQYRKNYMLLDSRYRSTTEQSVPQINSFSWNYVQKNQDTIDGSVNVIGNVRDIIALQIHPFRIPYDINADNKYARISVLFEEISSQAFVAHEQRKFHFMMQSNIDGGFINLSNDSYKDNFFVFEKPITTLGTLSVTFGNPLERITFDRDRDYCALDYFIIAPSTQITTEKIHNLSNGDRVYITGFTVGFVNPALTEQKRINDEIQELVNDSGGHVITYINATTISIPLDTSNIQSIDSTTRPKIFYGSKRIFMPVTLHYIHPEI